MKELIGRLHGVRGNIFNSEDYAGTGQDNEEHDDMQTVLDAIAALEAAEADRHRLEAENTVLRDALRAKIANSDEYPVILPDGSAFSILSLPLPEDHWLYAEYEYEPGAEYPKELPAPILNHAQHRDKIVAAVRYAIRGTTRCGREPDFDPDAMVQNAVYALCGPYGELLTDEEGK